MKIRKKTFILLITYLVATVVALGAYTAVHLGMERSYRRSAEYGYEHAFEELIAASRTLDEALGKARYASGAALSGELCAEIYGSSLAAKMTLAALPFSTQELENTAAFIDSAGELSRSCLRECAEGGFDDDARRSFAELSERSGSIYGQLTRLREAVDNGEILMDEPENVFDNGEKRVSAAMLDIEAGLESGEKRTEPVSVGASVGENEAKSAAAKFFGMDESGLRLLYESSSGARCFEFDGGTLIISAEGEPLSLSSSGLAEGEPDAVALEGKARLFLSEHGFEDMCLASAYNSGAVRVMDFECCHCSARCIGDGVRVALAADGSLYAFDASEHAKNHVERTGEPTPALGEERAASAVPSELNVLSSRLSYAPDGGEGRLCYDFECENGDGERLRILVDADTGEQYDILTV